MRLVMPLRELDCCGLVLPKEIILCCLFFLGSWRCLSFMKMKKPTASVPNHLGEERVGAWTQKNPKEFWKLDWRLCIQW